MDTVRLAMRHRSPRTVFAAFVLATGMLTLAPPVEAQAPGGAQVPGEAQEAGEAEEAGEAQEAGENFAFLIGTWDGVLEYLDYGDDRTRIQLTTTLTARWAGEGREPAGPSVGLEADRGVVLAFSYEEPDGRIVTSEELIRRTAQGVTMGTLWRVDEETHDPARGLHRVMLSREGEDNGRPGTIRNLVARVGDELTITTWVTYTDAPEPLQRHQYRLHRRR